MMTTTTMMMIVMMKIGVSIFGCMHVCVCMYLCMAQIENVEKFLHHVNVTMRQKHNHKQLSIVVDRIESYDAVDAPSDECDKV